MLAGAARAEAAVAAKIDVTAYACIRDLPTLQAWIAEARETGIVAFSTKTTSLDPMQAELVGFSLATRPGRAAYVPIAHRTGAADLLGGGAARGPDPGARGARRAEAAARGPARSSRSARTSSIDWCVMNRHGIDVAPFDDTMLISYVLDGGTPAGHDIDALADKWLGHKPIPFKDVTGSGKTLGRLRPGRRSTGRRPMPPRTPT